MNELIELEQEEKSWRNLSKNSGTIKFPQRTQFQGNKE